MMKITVSKLRGLIRKVIKEHVGDEHHEHGAGSHKEEPYDNYVKNFAAGYYEEGKFEDYLGFGHEYGYDEDQLGEWFNSAGMAAFKRRENQQLEDDLRTGRIDLEKNPYALD